MTKKPAFVANTPCSRLRACSAMPLPPSRTPSIAMPSHSHHTDTMSSPHTLVWLHNLLIPWRLYGRPTGIASYLFVTYLPTYELPSHLLLLLLLPYLDAARWWCTNSPLDWLLQVLMPLCRWVYQCTRLPATLTYTLCR